jgi:hypothetical protein
MKDSWIDQEKYINKRILKSKNIKYHKNNLKIILYKINYK